MAKQTERKINWLERNLPEGLLVDSAWLSRHGYSTALRSQYVAAGWLEQPARRVYRRPRGSLRWQQVAISLQTLLNCPLAVGGRTALDLHGYAHYLSQATTEVHLYGSKPAPRWLAKLRAGARFLYHNDRRLFAKAIFTESPNDITSKLAERSSTAAGIPHAAFAVQTWGQWDWPLLISTPEKAILELLDELPKHESFHQVDKLFEGAANLSPRRLQWLLSDCRSVKVKRLFFYFADRHRHAWLNQIKREVIEFGAGKRMLVKGGKLDAVHGITVPGDMDAV